MKYAQFLNLPEWENLQKELISSLTKKNLQYFPLKMDFFGTKIISSNQ